MKKIVLKVFLAACILFGLGNYASYLMTGKIPNIAKQVPDIPNFNISRLTDSLSKKINLKNEDSIVEKKYLFKWRDAKGVIHYTSEKPLEDIDYESIKLRNDINIVPAVSENEITNKEPIQQPPPMLPFTELPTNVYSPEGIEHLFNQAKDIQNLVNEQYGQQEKIINKE